MAVSSGLRLDIESGHAPLLITARLRTGVGLDLPYGLDLAGMLASRMRVADRETMHRQGRLTTNPLPDTTEMDVSDMSLPLARCLTGAEWHWLASCALPVEADVDPEPRTFYRVVDSSWAQRAAQRPLPYHHSSKGPYRDMMMPAPVVICPSVQWRAVGDPVAVLHLLKGLRFIGRRRAVGEGGVLSWSVEPVEADPARWAHLDDGGGIARPCPTECAEALGVGYRVGWYAVRPPSWHPDRLAELAMTPEVEEEW